MSPGACTSVDRWPQQDKQQGSGSRDKGGRHSESSSKDASSTSGDSSRCSNISAAGAAEGCLSIRKQKPHMDAKQSNWRKIQQNRAHVMHIVWAYGGYIAAFVRVRTCTLT